MGEKVKFLYNHQTEYKHDDLNKVGATTDLTLRTITAPAAGTTNYVRKFGKQLTITGCTAIDDPTANMTIKVYALDGTLLGSRVNGGAFVAGSACTAQGVYIEVSAAGGAGTLAATESITLTGHGALTVNFPTETIADGASMNFYLAESGSTYYDSGMMYGGARHTPVAGSEQFAYFHPEAADTALGARTIVHVLDSCYYQIDEYAITNVDTIWQAALGETPRLVTVIGASEFRDVEHDGNNTDTVYVSKTGVDGAPNTGTYQLPYLSHSHAFTNRGARTYLNTMDSETYVEDVTLSANMTIEPIYNKISNMKRFTLTSTTINIYGYIFNSNCYGIYQNNLALNFLGEIKNCTAINAGIYVKCNSFNGNVNKNKCSYFSYGIHIVADANSSGNILKNISFFNTGNIGYEALTGGTHNITIKNNICYDSTSCNLFIWLWAGTTFSGTVENNTLFNSSSDGLYIKKDGNFTGIVRNIIAWNNQNFDISMDPGTITITHTNYSTKIGFTIGAGCITTDPQLCKTEFPYKLGISRISSAYRTDSATLDMGAHLRGIVFSANSITLNGFLIDGLNNYFKAIYQSATRTGNIIKWCTFQNFQGIMFDDYATADTNTEILNCNMNNNGQALALTYGGNKITKCIFYKNSKINIWVDQSGHTINHCVIFQAENGLYVDSNGGGIICKNSIIDQNSLYGIYSEISMNITYCCITDAITSNVDMSGNIVDNPLFINTTDDNENFHLKTIEQSYNIESSCKEAADDGYDIGAWLVDYGIVEDSWEKYTVEFNPRTLDDLYSRKGGLQFEDGQGDYSGWSKGRRIRLPLVWAGNSATSESQRLTLRHFSEREISKELEYTEAECEFLVSLLPIKYYGQGVNATIDATAKTLTDNVQSWVKYNAKKGFFCTVIFESQLAGNIDAAAKTVTKVGAGWVVDEWEGYYFPYDGYYWYIKSNTATILTLSDPNGDLIDNANFDFNITKQFKILKSSKTVLTLRDDDSELIDGNYDFYIDYIKSNVIASDFGAKQAVYDFEKNKTKSGYSLTYEEID